MCTINFYSKKFIVVIIHLVKTPVKFMNWKQLFKTKSVDQILHDAAEQEQSPNALRRTLGVWDLTALGVAAILGAGVFSTIGTAASTGGPAVVFLFIFTAIACGFSAFCYAEFASNLPISGSAYTYAYASFGELLAWIIGWDLLMEYAIGNIAVAISWSQYFTSLLAGYGILIPKYLTMDYLSASRAYEKVQALLQQGQTMADITAAGVSTSLLKGYSAWIAAPRIGGIPIICDLPALLITLVITWIVFLGIEESRITSNILVFLKVLIVVLVICVGGTYVRPDNWHPFAPNGAQGVLKGVSAVFFAYIGFDAISATAEECRNPQRDLPIGMIYSLIVCTTLYALVALVLTGMMSYTKLGVGDPLAYVFGPEGVNIPWLCGIIDIGAVIALSTVLLVYQIGQPRIWMAMSRDGLLPPLFSVIHPKYKTPWISTLITGLVVAVPSLFMNLTEVTDLASIGTLSAFTLVCGGVLKLGPKYRSSQRKFKTPYISSKYIFPILVLGGTFLLFHLNRDGIIQFWTLETPVLPKIPTLVFLLLMVVLTYLSFVHSLSLIPLLGLTSCSYLMTELGVTNWIRFGGWLVVGLSIYFVYGIRHSRLRLASNSSSSSSST
jgi:basic amino acid/polyamine antiporter, APA family